jgi:4-hydroxy-tetrahydrodipicolinate synthase
MKKIENLKNAITALITPFKEDLSLDEEKYREFIRFQINNGCQLLTMGTTGESSTLSHEEHHRAIDITVDEAKKSGKNPLVIAGTGSNSTKEAISLSKYAENAGADCLLHVVPYYNKPAQHSLIEHFSAIADSVSIPIIIYNIPGRTGVNLEVETLLKIAKSKNNIIAVKEASGNIEQITKTIKSLPEEFIVLSGDDNLTYHIMALGGKGVISVASNVIPKKIAEFTEAMNKGDWTKARKMHMDLFDFFKILFVEANPGPVKYIAELKGIMNRRMRLPMSPPLEENQMKIKKVLQNLKLI